MDLAKIRKKSLQPQADLSIECSTVPVPTFVSSRGISDTAPATPVAGGETLFQEAFPVIPDPFAAYTLPTSDFVAPGCVAPSRTPIEAILAGRAAAGCNTEIIGDDAYTPVIDESSLEFLCFRVSDEFYGINIMDIKEIIRPREVTEVPRAPSFVSGVLSLRGVIIPIIDMRVRLGLVREMPTGKERIIVIKNNSSFSGILVDEVTQVVQVQQDAVERVPGVLDGIDREFVSGLARAAGRLIILLNLENIVDINLY